MKYKLYLRVRVDHRIMIPKEGENGLFRSTRRRGERLAVLQALGLGEPPSLVGEPHGSAVVTFTRYGMRLIDDDTLAYIFKTCRDQVADWFDVADGPNDPIHWQYRQRRYVEKEANPKAKYRPNAPRNRYVTFFVIKIRLRIDLHEGVQSDDACEQRAEERRSE